MGLQELRKGCWLLCYSGNLSNVDWRPVSMPPDITRVLWSVSRSQWFWWESYTRLLTLPTFLSLEATFVICLAPTLFARLNWYYMTDGRLKALKLSALILTTLLLRQMFLVFPPTVWATPPKTMTGLHTPVPATGHLNLK